MPETKTLVWRWPWNARKAHLFVKGRDDRSLCGRWMYAGSDLAEWDGRSAPGDCRACVYKAAKEKR